MSSEKTYTRSKGFTLLEVLISVAIIATALVALLSLQNRSIIQIESAGKTERARLISQRLMTEGEFKGVHGGEVKGEEDGYRYTLRESRINPDSMPEGVVALPGRQISLDIEWGETEVMERFSFAEYIYEK